MNPTSTSRKAPRPIRGRTIRAAPLTRRRRCLWLISRHFLLRSRLAEVRVAWSTPNRKRLVRRRRPRHRGVSHPSSPTVINTAGTPSRSTSMCRRPASAAPARGHDVYRPLNALTIEAKVVGRARASNQGTSMPDWGAENGIRRWSRASRCRRKGSGCSPPRFRTTRLATAQQLRDSIRLGAGGRRAEPIAHRARTR